MKYDIDTFSSDGIKKIQDVEILSDDDFSVIKSLGTELQRVFEVKQMFRTETEMRYSVLNDMKFPTLPSKYWQCIREQNVFYTNLVYLACEYEIEQGNLEILQCDFEDITGISKRDNANRRIKNAEIKKKEFLLINMNVEAHDRVREIRIWEEIKKEIIQQDPNFNINDVNEHQTVSLKQRWENELRIGELSGQQDMMKNAMAQLQTINHAQERSLR